MRGFLSHAGKVFEGLNPVSVLSEIVTRTEINMDFADAVNGEAAPPPTWLYMKDSKDRYDVSMPLTARGCFSVLTLKQTPSELLSKVKRVCQEGFGADVYKRQKENHVHCPAKDFTRSRKISFSDCMMSVVCMHGGTPFSEILEYFPRNMDVPTVSAYLQQRAKIKQSAFEELFNATITLHQEAKSYQGYRLLAADGSDVQIPTNPNDTDTFFPGTNGQKPYNLVHLNALYDILSNTYQDAVVQDRLKFAEHEALNQMVDRSRITRAILTADRGYESYNIMAHLQEKRWLYLIRVRDIDKGGIISRLDLPGDEEFDLDIDLQMTRKASKKTKELFEDRNHYRYIPPNSRLYYLPLRLSLIHI